MARYDAVFVGSGINALTGRRAARAGGLERVRARAGRAPRRRDPHGRRTTPCRASPTRCSAPGIRSSQGSAAYAELGDELHARGLEYVNTDLPTATAFPDGEAMFLQTSLEANVAEFDRHHAGDGAAWAAQFEAFMANADLSFGVLGTELWSTPGSRSAGGCCVASAAAGCSTSPAARWRRAGTGPADVRLRAGARAARAVGAAHGARTRQRRLAGS